VTGGADRVAQIEALMAYNARLDRELAAAVRRAETAEQALADFRDAYEN
jgi:hypothetical protein